MTFDPTEYSDAVIVTMSARYMPELMSVALLLTHIPEADIPPAPPHATNHQVWLNHVYHLAYHPNTDKFSRGQLMLFLEGVKNA